MTAIPHVDGVRGIPVLVWQGFPAMRKVASNTELSHVPRDYPRPEEVNAVIAAAAKVGRNGNGPLAVPAAGAVSVVKSMNHESGGFPKRFA